MTDTLTPQRIKQLRKARGFSQAELSRRTGIHSSTMSHIEGGKVAIWPGYLTRIARALGVSVDELKGAA